MDDDDDDEDDDDEVFADEVETDDVATDGAEEERDAGGAEGLFAVPGNVVTLFLIPDLSF